MKMGVRKPSVKKSVSARTKGRVTRKVKKSVTPLYGEKGTGIFKDPKKAIYNEIYDKTTTSVTDDNSSCGCWLIIIIALIIVMSLIWFGINKLFDANIIFQIYNFC